MGAEVGAAVADSDVVATTRPKLAVQDLAVVRGGQRILAVPRLGVDAAKVLAVIGPNGAGKSTLLHVMALLERPTAGQIYFDGMPVQGNLLPYRRRMAVVFQEPLLLDTSVFNNVAVGLRLRRLGSKAIKERVERWLDRFGIGHLSRRSARTLSGGEAQRASLARAFALAPEVLLLDEPFAALDQPTREVLMDDLAGALRETGVATVLVTHDRNEALRLADGVAVLMAGQLRQWGTPGEVFAAPVDQEVAAFVGMETIAPGRVIAATQGIHHVAVGGTTIEATGPATISGDVLVGLRPEDVVLTLPGDTRPITSARNQICGLIQRIDLLGPQARVVLDCGFPLIAIITKQSLEEMYLGQGMTVVASFKASAVHLIARGSL
ncbi:MAG: ABC transporter ATP-binding protein [Dehalococcoidia bacterium]